MQIRIVTLLITLITLLGSSFSLSAESGSAKHNVKDPWYHIEKGNHGEQITLEEFNELIQQLENEVVGLKKALSETTVLGANLPYEVGKAWEIELETTKKNIETTFKYLNALRTNPNSMVVSSGLYATLSNIDRSLLYFEKIPQFEKSFGKRHVSLFLWRLAFERAHLLPLAMAKDMKTDLYENKKEK
jgi:hypothetical protein